MSEGDIDDLLDIEKHLVVNKIAIASDHAGFELKQLLIESLSSDLEIEDLGTDSLNLVIFQIMQRK